MKFFKPVKTAYYFSAILGLIITSCSNPLQGSKKNTPRISSNVFSSISISGPVAADGTTVTVTIEIRDTGNRPIAGMIPTYSATNTANTNIYGPCSISDENGVSTCTFSSTKSEEKKISVLTPFEKEISTLFLPRNGVQMTFNTQPSSTSVAGLTLTRQPEVTLWNASNNVDMNSTAKVTLAVFTDSTCNTPAPTTPNGMESLNGTLNLPFTNGVAKFSDVQINKSGNIYFKAISGTIESECSSMINVHATAYDTTQSVVSTDSSVISDHNIVATLTTKDMYGNTNPNELPNLNTFSFNSSSVGGTGILSSITDSGSGVYTANFKAILVGAVTISAKINGVDVSTNASTTVLPGTAASLTFTTPPSTTGTAGVPLAVQPVITPKDINGNIATGYSSNLTLSVHSNNTCSSAEVTGGAVVTTNPKTPSSGITSFTGVEIRKTNVVAIKVSDIPSGGTLSACFNGITIAPNVPNKLIFTSIPTNGTAGSAFSTTPVTQVLDFYDNIATNSSLSVDLALYSNNTCATAVLTTPNSLNSILGTSTVAAVAGVNSFTGLGANKAGSGFYLKASSGSILSSCVGPITISPGNYDTTQSVVTASASTVVSNTSMTTTLTTKDKYGNLNPSGLPANSNILFTSTTSPGTGVFSAVTNAGSGVYTSNFTGKKVGTVNLGATISGVDISTNASITVLPGPPTSLSFTTPPSTTGTAGSILAIQPVVSAKDTFGNIATSYTSAITLSVHADATCSTAAISSGMTATTNPKTATSGVATFSGVNILKTNAISIKATDSSFSTCFTGITITPGLATKLVFISGPMVTTAGTVLATQPSVAAQDINGNTATGTIANVGLSLFSNSACTISANTTPVGNNSLTGITNLPTTGGLANFSGVSINRGSSGTANYLLATTNTSLTSNCFGPISVNAAAYSTNVSTVSVSNSSVTSGSSIVATLTTKDNYGNLNPSGLPVLTSILFTSSSVGGTGSFGSTLSAGLGVYTANFTGILAGSVTIGAKISSVSVANNANVTINPISNGMKITTLSRTFLIGETVTTSPLAITAVGVSPAPLIKWLDNSVDFHDVEVGANHQSSIHLIMNKGNEMSSGCNAPVLSGIHSSDFSILSDDCNASDLNIGQSCAVSIQANPASTGPTNAMISRTCTNGGTTSMALSANGVSTHATQLVRTGSDDHCAILSDKTLKCWGSNSSGQLGDGSMSDHSIPTHVSNISNVSDASGGNGFNCALTSDGKINCWGANSSNFSTAGISSAIQLSAGDLHACAILADATVKCWGNNTYEQLGDGSISNAIAISSGFHQSCAVINDGTIQCWGTGFLGNGTGSQTSAAPITVSGITNATAVTVGRDHTCALLSSNQIKCWGENTYGQLGNSTTLTSFTPVSVTGINNAISVVSSPSNYGNSTCALLSSGAVQCWGDGQFMQLGTSSSSISNSPKTIIEAIKNVSSIALSNKGGCALLGTGKVQCWGSNSYGEIGTGRTIAQDSQQLTAVKVSGLSGASAISNGISHTCAIVSGLVKCVGLNSDGQLGDGTNNLQYTPVSVLGITTAKSLASGHSHSCSVLTNGTIKCWGKNTYGQLGDTTNLSRNSPVIVNGITTALTVVSGESHSCALISGGTVKCWGLNSTGQLGDSTNTSKSTPVSTLGINNATAITAGNNHTCATLSDGTVKCWGESIAGNQYTPTAINSLGNVAEISAGNNFTCARLIDSTLRCWGSNSFGQFGNGNTTNSIIAISAAKSLGAISKFTTTSGSVCAVSGVSTYCWGNNSSGNLGDGTNTQNGSPVLTQGLSTNTSTLLQNSPTASGSCMIDGSNDVYCWGNNSYSQSGLDLSKPGFSIGI